MYMCVKLHYFGGQEFRHCTVRCIPPGLRGSQHQDASTAVARGNENGKAWTLLGLGLRALHRIVVIICSPWLLEHGKR